MAHGNYTRNVASELVSATASAPVTSAEQVWDYNMLDGGNNPRTQEDINAEVASTLSGIDPNAEENQNTFSNVKVGSTTIAADSKTDTLELVAGNNITLTADATNDKVTISATGGGGDDHNAFANIIVGSEMVEADAPEDTFEIAGSGGVSVGADNDTITIGLDLSAAITGLSASTAAAARNDYIVAQYVGGNDASPVNNTYVRRSLANLFKALNSTDINTALGYVPYSQTSANNLAARVQTLEDTAVVKDSNGNVAITTGNVTLGKAGATIQLTGNSVLWGSSELATQYWVNSQGFVKSSGVTSVAMTVPTGLSVSGSPITSTGTLAISFASGYSIPTTADVTKGVTAYGWGNHADAGYLDINKLKSTTKATYDSNTITNTQSRQYAVVQDKSGYLSVNVPWDNTTYSAATTSSAGLMSASDKTKLNGIASGAEVNQNAFSNVKVGSTTIAADSKTDTLELVAGTNVTLTADATNDKVTIAASGEANQNAFSHIAVGSDTLDAQSKTDTFELEGSGGIALSTNDVDIVTIGLDLSAAITGLGTGTSAATRTDYIVAQWAGGNDANPVNNTYVRRSLANLFKALNSTDINTALGYVPYSQTSANNLAARVQTLEDTAVVKDSNGNVNITTGNVSLGKAGATIQLTGSSVKWGSSEVATQYWVNSQGFVKSSGVTSVAMTVPTGLSVSGSPITSTGTLAITLASGYAIPTASDVTKGVTAYGWGDHSQAGYLGTGSMKFTTNATYDSNSRTNTQNRQYAVTPDKSGYLSVNVPWESYSTATTSAAGLMSASDKTKLNGIASGAEVNQNAFSNVNVGSTTIAADSKTDTLELVAGTNVTLTADATNDKVTIAASGEANQNAFSHIAVGSDMLDAQSKTDTFELEGSGGIALSTNDVDIVTIGLDLSAAITGLGLGTSAAVRTDYIVAQYAGGNSASPVNNTYYRRSIANLFKALNQSDINTALGYVPYSQTSANNLAARVQTLEDTAVVKDSSGNVAITTGNVTLGKAGATIQLTGSSVLWGSSELATQYWVNNRGFAMNSVATTSANGLMSAADKTKLDNISDEVQPYEANLRWGGKNFAGSFGCLDAALVSELGANRMMFAKAAGITVEYSRDTGTTWTDYGLSDADKVALFSSGGSVLIGKADSTNKATANGAKYQLRITVDTGVAGIYTVLNKFVLYISTSGSNDCTVTIQKALQSTPNTYVGVATDIPLSGWSGYNVVNCGNITTYGNTASTQYGRLRFIFKANGGNTTYPGLQILKILGFGGVGWTTPSTMAKTGHLYSYDSSQNATFPAKVTAAKFNDVSITKTTPSSGTTVTISTDVSDPILELKGYGETRLSSMSRPTISFNGQGSGDKGIATLGDIPTTVAGLGYTNIGSSISIMTDRTETDAGVSILGTSFVEISNRSGGEGVFIGRNLSGGLADVYLGNDSIDDNRIASKGYVDSQVVSPAGSLIIVGEINANTNRVISFTQGGPLSSYSECLNHITITFSNATAVTNLTTVIYNGSEYGTGYIHRGYAFVVTTAGTIEGTALAVGDLAFFWNDYASTTLNSSFKWRKM